LKLNVDAAFSLENQQRTGAAGAILQNSNGDFVASSHVASANMAEAMAMLHGISFANYMGCNMLEAESDSLETIQLCSGEDRIWNEATQLSLRIFSYKLVILGMWS
jgi:ribonuclease HI